MTTYEIPADAACEMNTCTEYNIAQKLCENITYNSTNFFNNVILYTENKSAYKILSSNNESKNIWWLKQLFFFYNEAIKPSATYEELFSPEEMVYIVKNSDDKEVAFFSYAQDKKYILLRRIYIIPNYRRRQIGRKIVEYVYLFSKFNSKELRVNVYDDNAETFYKFIGFQEIFKTFRLEP